MAVSVQEFYGRAGQISGDCKTSLRRPRADARRNRERVLEAAKDAFATAGPEASLETVARRAGVGIGTLYRHFPTRGTLFEAVYRREIEQLAELADVLASELSPVDALRRWLHASVRFAASEKGMASTLFLAAHGSSDFSAGTFDGFARAAAQLLDRAVAAGDIRPEIGADDLLRVLFGMCYTHDRAGWQAKVEHLLDVVFDGLRGNS
jgi:AcrR family transcriptional regulator